MRRSVPRGDPARRLGITLLCIIFVLSLFAGRLVQMQGMESGYYRKLAKKQEHETIVLPAQRGQILGADGTVLAMTVNSYEVTADPPLIPKGQEPQVAAALAGPLGVPAASVLSQLEHPSSPDYVVIAQGVPAEAGTAINGLNLPGVTLTSSYAREYPDTQVGGNLLGFTSTDNHGSLVGQAGIEQQFNSVLAGKPGSEQVETGTDGLEIPLAGSSSTPAVNGRSIKLTIYPNLQYEAEQACAKRVEQTNASNCTVVIMQPQTGRVLAMAQWPAFNPNNVSDVASSKDIAVADTFQPGSTAKVITAAAAFERGGQTPMSAYNIPYQIEEGGQLIHDAEWAPGERYTIAGIIAHSSNIGMSQVAKHISPQTEYDYLRAFGLGQTTGLGLQGESSGILPPVSQWSADTRYTLSYGQGVAATAVQMASVYATIANGGVRVQPTLVAGTINASGKYIQAPPPPTRRVITAKTSSELLQILQQVPAIDTEGGQPWGEIKGYAIAAKTGTSQEAGNNCALCVYGSSYIGMAPGNDPQLLVAVNVQNPRKGGYFGDVVAGPVFNQVMNFALATLKIPPDGATPPKLRLNARR